MRSTYLSHSVIIHHGNESIVTMVTKHKWRHVGELDGYVLGMQRQINKFLSV